MSTEARVSELRRVPIGKRLLWGGASGIVLAALTIALSHLSFFQSFEFRTLDQRHRLLGRPSRVLDQIALVLIDEYSIQTARKQMGLRYPWPRDVYAPIIQFLKDAGARAVVFDMIFADPWPQRKFDDKFGKAAGDAGNVTIGFKMEIYPEDGGAGGGKALEKASLDVEGWRFPPTRKDLQSLLAPIPQLLDGARTIGYVNCPTDDDGILRRIDVVYPFPPGKGVLVRSLGLAAAQYFLGQDARAVVEGRKLRIGECRIPLSEDGRMLLRYYGPESVFKMVTAVAVINSHAALEERKARAEEAAAAKERGKEEPKDASGGSSEPLPELSVDPSEFKDRIVFVGVNAAGLEDVVPAPVSTRFLGPAVHATVCANILEGSFLRELPTRNRAVLLAAIGLAAGLATFLAWKPALSLAAALILAGVYEGAALLVFRKGLVIDMFFPALLLALVYLAATLAAYLAEGRHKKEISRAFGQYLSPAVIRTLMKNPDALRLGGESREITVHFSDIQRFSTFSEKMTPQELVSFLNVYLSSMTDIILDHKGVVDKYEGDLIMAFWGAPLDLPDPAAQACLAVVAQRKALAELNRRFEAEGRPAINFRTGLNTGPAVVGNMGSTRRFAYTAMGDTVNLASRLEGANKFFGTYVMMSEAVRKAAGDAVLARRIGRIRVVGKAVPTTVYELLGRAGDLEAEALERIRRFEGAAAALEAGRASEAAAALEALLKEAPDPVAEKYLKKAREMETSGEAWDGVWVLTEKG